MRIVVGKEGIETKVFSSCEDGQKKTHKNYKTFPKIWNGNYLGSKFQAQNEYSLKCASDFPSFKKKKARMLRSYLDVYERH